MKPSHIAAYLVVAFLFSRQTHADTVMERWVTRYSGPGNSDDRSSALAVDGTGNVIVTGSASGACYTAKYAAAGGELLWENRYNGLRTGNAGTAVAVDGASNVIVAGCAANSGRAADFYTAKYAGADGALLWEKRFNGTGSGVNSATAVAVDRAGNAIVTGYAARSGGYLDYYTAKYLWKDGALLWEIRYSGTGASNNMALAVAVDGAGEVTVTGRSIGNGNNYDYYTAKYTADGALLWEQRYNGTGNGHDTANAVVVDATGCVIVTGQSTNITGNDDYYTAKYAAADGALLWERRYNGLFNMSDAAYAVAVDGAGNVIVTGSSIGGIGNKDRYTAKYAAADGAVIWERRQDAGGIGDAFGSAVVVDEAGDVIIAGSSSNAFHMVKYAGATGVPLGQKYYNGPTTGADIINGCKQLALTPGGGVVVTGYSWNGTNYDYATVKYGPDNDADHDGLLDDWERAYFGTTAGHSADDDADGDGLTELLELAFNRDPLKPDAGSVLAVVNDGGFLTTTIAKRAGVNYTVQTAATPDAPAFAAATTTLLLDNATTLKVRDNFPIAAPGSRFMRVKVTAAP